MYWRAPRESLFPPFPRHPHALALCVPDMPLLVQLLAHPLVVPFPRYDTRQAPNSAFILDVEPSVFVSCLVVSLMLTGPISLQLLIAETRTER